MKKQHLFVSLVVASMLMCSLSSHAAFIYDISEFSQSNNSRVYVDTFSDDIVPPSGSNTAGDYRIHNGEFGSAREHDGILELNSEDAEPAPSVKLNIHASLANADYYFTSGAGGYVKGVFGLGHGLFSNAGVSISISNYGQNYSFPYTSDMANIGIIADVSGHSYFGYTDEANEDLIDITDELVGITSITLLLELNSLNQVTGSLDYGSDGTYELVVHDYTTLSFTPGDTNDFYTGNFEAFEEASVPEPETYLLLGLGIFLLWLKSEKPNKAAFSQNWLL